jgi:hypothetical protein
MISTTDIKIVNIINNANKGDKMKKYMLVLCLIGVISFSYALPVGFEGGAGYVLEENHNYFFVNGSALINIANNFYVRTELARLSFHSGSTVISLGTMSSIGTILPIDLMMFFPQQTFNPYGLAGLNLTTGGGTTYFGLRAGAGVEFKFNEARFFPFVEANLDLASHSNGTSSTDNVITIKGGIRVK